MDPKSVGRAMEEALDGKRLLTHPFYRRWEAGDLAASELKSYAEQYRYFEITFPEILRRILGQLPEGDARSFVEQNLADEVGNPSHVDLFETFVDAVNARRSELPSPAMTQLLNSYGAALEQGPASSIGALVAYECQASEVALSKAKGLRDHYGLGPTETVFWDVHAQLDVSHAEWATRALADTASGSAEFQPAIRRVAQAWWEFLDEREELAAA